MGFEALFGNAGRRDGALYPAYAVTAGARTTGEAARFGDVGHDADDLGRVGGIGGGMLTPVGTAMLFRAFPPQERAQASKVLVIPSVLAPALGPVVESDAVRDGDGDGSLGDVAEAACLGRREDGVVERPPGTRDVDAAARTVQREDREGATCLEVQLDTVVRSHDDELGVAHLFGICSQPVPDFTKFETVKSAAAAPSRVEMSRNCLEAHEILMAINPDNIPKFKDVAKFLAEDLKKASGAS